MDFGLDKCAKYTLRKGIRTASENLKHDNGTLIENFSEEASYWYLDQNNQ